MRVLKGVVFGQVLVVGQCALVLVVVLVVSEVRRVDILVSIGTEMMKFPV